MLTFLFNGILSHGQVYLVSRDLGHLGDSLYPLDCEHWSLELKRRHSSSGARVVCVTIATISGYQLQCNACTAGEYYTSIECTRFAYATTCVRFASEMNDQVSTVHLCHWMLRKRCTSEMLQYIIWRVYQWQHELEPSRVNVAVTMGISSVSTREGYLKHTLTQCVRYDYHSLFERRRIFFQIYWSITVTAKQSSNTMDTLRRIAARLITPCVYDDASISLCHWELLLSRIHCLTIEPLTRSYAWDMFEMSPSLMQSSFSR